jgi:hypothetical protein
MAKILAFRRPEENCTNCWYHSPPRGNHKDQAVPPVGYCRHPDRAKNSDPAHPARKELLLPCDPGNWCPKYVSADSSVMKKLQFVSEIKFVLMCMRQRLKSNADPVEKADEYRELVDQFYMEYKKQMTINQYKAAKRDEKHFVALIEEAFEYYKKESKNRKP